MPRRSALRRSPIKMALVRFVALNQALGVTREDALEALSAPGSDGPERSFTPDTVTPRLNKLLEDGCLTAFVRMSARENLLRYRAEVDVKFDRDELFRSGDGNPRRASGASELDMLFDLKQKIELRTLEWVARRAFPAGDGAPRTLLEHFGFSPISILDQEIAVSRPTGDLIITCQFLDPTLFQDWIRTVVRSFREVADTHTTSIRQSSVGGGLPIQRERGPEEARAELPDLERIGVKATHDDVLRDSPLRREILSTVSCFQGNGLTDDDVAAIVCEIHGRERARVIAQVRHLLKEGYLQRYLHLGVRKGIYPYRAAVDVKLDRRQVFESGGDSEPPDERAVLAKLRNDIRLATRTWLENRPRRARDYEDEMNGICEGLPLVSINNILEVVSRPTGDLTIIVQHADQHRFNDWVRDVVRSFPHVLDTHTTTIHYSSSRGERNAGDKRGLPAVRWLAENLGHGSS